MIICQHWPKDGKPCHREATMWSYDDDFIWIGPFCEDHAGDYSTPIDEPLRWSMHDAEVQS